jgi:hypothetical protein
MMRRIEARISSIVGSRGVCGELMGLCGTKGGGSAR